MWAGNPGELLGPHGYLLALTGAGGSWSGLARIYADLFHRVLSR